MQRLLPSAARRLEPALAPTVRLALDVPGDHSADPRALVLALAQAARRAGVTLRTGACVERVEHGGGRVTGVGLAGGEVVRADRVVVAAGAWSGAIEGLPRIPLRPVKGQILRLRDPAHHGPGGDCCSASCASRAATSSRAATGATCSARRWRSAASTRP